MLVLSRRLRETLVIGDNIAVTVSRIDEEGVTLLVRICCGESETYLEIPVREDGGVRINQTIWVQIVKIQVGQVRVGVEAPTSVRVDRWEVRQRKDRGE